MSLRDNYFVHIPSICRYTVILYFEGIKYINVEKYCTSEVPGVLLGMVVLSMAHSGSCEVVMPGTLPNK